MSRKIKRAGVIGAGVMGATIAAQLANVGIETLLLDIVPRELTDEDKKKGLTEESTAFRNKLAINGLETALKSKPASFYVSENAKRVQVGNLEDDLDKLREVDWIVEVVVERLDIKQSVFEKIESVLEPGTLVTSNTSGISAKAMAEGRSETFRKHFAITHFFNPPRYMKLLEIVPCEDTLPEVLETLAETCEKVVGKGVVWAKDTPNFIANRIGVYSMLYVIRSMLDLGLSIEAVDKLTGPVIGHPKSASFRTADLVGLDTLLHVAENVYEGAPDDEKREMFQPPELVQKMLEKKLLGEKTKQGFYKKSKDEKGKRVILSIDPESFEYTPQEKVKFASLEAAQNVSGTGGKIKALFYADDKAGEFTFRQTAETLIYSANRIPEIADDIVNVDNAMKWGFAWKLGPFEAWDALGVAKSVEKMKAAGYEIPGWVAEMLAQGNDAFYKMENGKSLYYDPAGKSYVEVPVKPGVIYLPALKDRDMTVAGNKGATLVDLGDGVACLEFHTKMNAMGDDIVSMVYKSADIVAKDFDGLVIANHGTNFSAGANLPMVLFTAQEEEWDDLDWMIKTFQDAFMKLKYLDKPVVAAPAGMALGGGCEICLASDRVRFAAETYMGLVEVGVGLIPAGGGTKELYLRKLDAMGADADPRKAARAAFEVIGMAKVSTSAHEARDLGFLRDRDPIVFNRDHLLKTAKEEVEAMAHAGYTPPAPRQAIPVGGDDTLALVEVGLHNFLAGRYISEHDAVIGRHLGHILSGGAHKSGPSPRTVTEQQMLDLEREAFLKLCGERKSLERIQHMLQRGKPLRN